MPFEYSISKWLRVSKGNPCHVCAKPDWCMVSQDGKAAICARIQSDKKVGEAGWLHILDTSHSAIQPQIKQVKQNPPAPVNVLDKVYLALFDLLPLSEIHKEKLISRGLTEDQIKTLSYKTLPLDDRWPVVHSLLSLNVQLKGVPGFWIDESSRWRLGGQPGILIPVKDLQGRITGAQIRCDDTTNGKYKWLSSADKPSGCGSGSPVHVSMPAHVDTSKVWITEGPLKADISRLKLNRIVLAIPGVGTWAKVIPIIRTLRSKSVVVALDMDKLTNPTVELYKKMLIENLVKLNIKVFEANWNPKYKGLDDLLALGELKW